LEKSLDTVQQYKTMLYTLGGGSVIFCKIDFFYLPLFSRACFFVQITLN
jgi:hypothetical protein